MEELDRRPDLRVLRVERRQQPYYPKSSNASLNSIMFALKRLAKLMMASFAEKTNLETAEAEGDHSGRVLPQHSQLGR